MTTQPINWSLHSIPIVYGLAFPPYMYAFLKAYSVSKSTHTNIVPRTNFEALKSKVAPQVYQSLQRCYGMHKNALEGFPFFAAAMVAGNVAGLPVSDMNIYAAEYIGSRLLYNFVYATVRSEKLSYLRSTVYFVSLAIPTTILWKAANAWNERVGRPI